MLYLLQGKKVFLLLGTKLGQQSRQRVTITIHISRFAVQCKI